MLCYREEGFTLRRFRQQNPGRRWGFGLKNY
jgi:hypothetical protein